MCAWNTVDFRISWPLWCSYPRFVVFPNRINKSTVSWLWHVTASHSLLNLIRALRPVEHWIFKVSLSFILSYEFAILFFRCSTENDWCALILVRVFSPSYRQLDRSRYQPPSQWYNRSHTRRLAKSSLLGKIATPLVTTSPLSRKSPIPSVLSAFNNTSTSNYKWIHVPRE